jgi:hypothetical protein
MIDMIGNKLDLYDIVAFNKGDQLSTGRIVGFKEKRVEVAHYSKVLGTVVALRSPKNIMKASLLIKLNKVISPINTERLKHEQKRIS